MSKTIFDNFFDEIVLNEMKQKFIDMVENKGVDDCRIVNGSIVNAGDRVLSSCLSLKVRETL